MSDKLSSDLASLTIDREARRSRRPSRGWLVALGIGLLGYALYAFGLPELRARALSTEVQVTEITTHSPIQASIDLTSTGYIEAQRISRVGAKLPGRVARTFVRQGDEVKEGDVLLELEGSDREAAIHAARMRAAAAEARVATARANLLEVRQQAERERTLAVRGVSPAARAEDLEARAASLEQSVLAAQAEVKAATAEVKALQVDLESMRILAPMAGTVVNKPPDVGELVGADLGGAVSEDDEQVVELADFDSLMVETDIPEGRLHLVKLGSPCDVVLDAFPSKRYRGEAVEIDPKVDRAKATVGVKVKLLDSHEGVLPDMSARVSFLSAPIDPAQLAQKPKAIVPASAVTDRGGSKVVFAIEDDVARMRNVALGESLAGGFELTSGPAVGTRVVADPPSTLRDGQKVKEEG